MKRLSILLATILVAVSCGTTAKSGTSSRDSGSSFDYYAPALSANKIQSNFLGCSFGCSKKTVMRKLKGTLNEGNNTYVVENVSFGGVEWDSVTFRFSGYDRLYQVSFSGDNNYYKIKTALRQRYEKYCRTTFSDIYGDEQGRRVSVFGGSEDNKNTLLIYIDGRYDVNKGTNEL